MKRIIECVPNFSEGRDPAIIKQITDAIESVDGIKLLDVDPGKATNRTVVTFVGEPNHVVEAAFRGIKKAYEVIDMSKHKGEHPRMGACDVCPLIPISGISMEETAKFAHKLGKRIGDELGLSGYFYEEAASSVERKNLAYCRTGEYEGLPSRMNDPQWKPDFGPVKFNPKFGMVAVGARDFLVAYNVNLNTTSVRRANSIAFDVREKGRIKRKGDPITGEIEKDENGNPISIPGSLKAVKAIGWYIEEYGIAQISMNLTNINITPIHIAFDEVCKKAESRGIRVTGSEIVGLVPLKSLLDAGKYFLKKQQRSVGVSEKELVKIAIKSMGLDELGEFDPKKRVIEYVLRDENDYKLVSKDLWEFANETASESPAPGGGSISAYVGSLGAALGAMVANLSAHKRGWDNRWEEFSDTADKAQEIKRTLLRLVDEDTKAFNKIMDAFSLPKGSDYEKQYRTEQIQTATRYAIEIPMQVMEASLEACKICLLMAQTGNPNSISDAGVGAICALAAVRGAHLNVRINSPSYNNKTFVNEIIRKAETIEKEAKAIEKQVIDLVNEVIKIDND
jgi:glutamate formiminotransferase/formiminotetrahydrofolate cyclodeaminase